MKLKEIKTLYDAEMYMQTITHLPRFDAEWLLKTIKHDVRFLEKYHTKLGWIPIAKCGNLTVAFVDKYAKHLALKHLIENKNCSIKVLNHVSNRFTKAHWLWISYRSDLPISFLFQHKKKLDWIVLTVKYNINDEFLTSFTDVIHWNVIAKNPTFNIMEENI